MMMMEMDEEKYNKKSKEKVERVWEEEERWKSLYIIYIEREIDIQGSFNKFPDFFVWALLLIVHTWNSSPLRSNLLRLQCTCCTVPTTSGSLHGSPLVWTCQWPSSQPLSSPQTTATELRE